jgi:hypothetical protein
MVLISCRLMMSVRRWPLRCVRRALLQIPIDHQPQVIGLAEQSAVIQPINCVGLLRSRPELDASS